MLFETVTLLNYMFRDFKLTVEKNISMPCYCLYSKKRKYQQSVCAKQFIPHEASSGGITDVFITMDPPQGYQ